MMRYPKRVAALMLVAGALFAAGTPVCLVRVRPTLTVYLLNWPVFLMQLIPFAVCAALWLPRTSRAAATTTLVLSGLMLLTAAVLYLPILWSARSFGGDMVALTFLATSAITLAVLLVGSAVAAIVIRVRQKGHNGTKIAENLH